MSSKFIKSYLLLSAVLFLILGLTVTACLYSHLQGGAFLDFLRPLFDESYKWFVYPRNYYKVFYHRIFVSVASVAGLVAVLSVLFRSAVGVFVALVVSVALIPEYLLLEGFQGSWIAIAWAGCVVSVGLIARRLARYNDGRLQSISVDGGEVSRVNAWEFLGFTALTVVFIALRFYLLNRIPNTWDTEFCPFRYTFWPSFQGLINHELGQTPQTSAGLSWNFIYWLMGHTDEPDNYFLYTRLLSESVSTVKYLLLFLFVRSLCGVFPAFLSVALLGFGPPEDWWAREPYLHQLPGVLAILVLWGTMRAYRFRRWIDFIALAVLIALTRFVYPSGMFFGFVPLTFFILQSIFKFREWKHDFLKVCFLFLGIAFWLSWRSLIKALVVGHWEWLAPFEVPSHSVLPVGIVEKLKIVFLRNGLDVIKGLTSEQVHPTHWTFALTLPPMRSTTSFVLVMLVAAIGRMLSGRAGAMGVLLFTALGWAVFPALMTEVADRRMGVSFVVLIVIAVREAQYLTSLLSVYVNRYLTRVIQFSSVVLLASYLGWVSASLHFGMGEGTPHQLIRGRLFREVLEDDALVVYLTGEIGCDIFFSVYKELQARDCKVGWTVVDYEGGPQLQSQMRQPTVRADHWAYRETKLNSCLQQHLNRKWNRYIFLLSEGALTQKTIADLKELYPQGELEEKTFQDGDARLVKVWIYRAAPVGSGV